MMMEKGIPVRMVARGVAMNIVPRECLYEVFHCKRIYSRHSALTRIGTTIMVIMMLLLSGCRHPTSSMIRYEPTAIETGEAITIVLGDYQKCDEDASPSCNVLPPSKSTEKEFESCLSSAIHAERPDLVIISAEKFQQAIFHGVVRDTTPRTIDAYMPLIKEPEFQKYANSNNLHYIVTLEVSYRRGLSHWSGAWDPHANDPFSFIVWVIGKEWGKKSSMKANILDTHNYVQSGFVSSHSQGNAGFAFPVILIIPIPIPFIWSERVETPACEALGKAIVQFIEGKNF